ncbi:hypothetical protein [Catalinimonas niigatensis]|uniref:hypothetical protein n=1 Tax=Catalinimonas niigatensis TaxID=1397264 RepID=UPI0026655E19|nr:hypothetical protein [Catalinimonas niigatensis]WPP48143.1 hypothetical protein PZB72_15845 [Catalinimonas niigatensis]
MKRYMLFSVVTLWFFLQTFTSALAQETVDNKIWKALSGVTYTITEDEYGELYVPVFSKDAKALEGKEVIVPGYIIPFEGLFKPEHVIVSSLPLASCFFCGSGGPETVMEVYLKKPIDYTEAIVAFKGKLKLNDKDYEQLMYILEDAEMIGEVGK